MKRRFLIAADGMNGDAEKAMIAFFREHGLGWWHHVPNFWLLADRSDKMTAVMLRDKIKTLRSADAKACLVMQIHDDITWAGLYPSGSTNRDEFDWIKKTWSGD